ncbi:MAG TPA: glutamine amidotransferase [Polyangiaceae bacterium LLY-WYZ-15_(1-7)]|nr:glutamine amidotransferase [Polyangiaceae bacterium LLY-WYZ-15_(1-7)]
MAGDGAGELGAVVVISDGADGDRRAPGEAPAPLEMNGVKIHTVAVGADETLRDDAIAELQADPIAFLRQPGEVRVVVRSTGSGGLRVPVTLRQGDEVVTEALVAVPEGGEAEAVLSFTPRRLGRAVYRVSIPTAEGDAVPQNNERAFLVRVTRDRLRVLLVAGAPSWDVRFLRAFLKRDPSIDLISFFILRTTSDMTMASPDELALIPFPTDELFREHLGSFDVVLFQNFDYGPYQMAPYLPRIRDYVQRGGSFAMVGGDRSFGSGGYAGTPLAEILPVRLPRSDAPPSRLVAEGRFSPEVDAELVRHPLVALAPEPGASVAAWARLAPLEGLNRVEAVEEPAQVLLRRPGRERLPVLVVGEAEEGRVLALTTDTSWRWGLTTGGRSGDATAFERFWDRALRWLARDPALEPASVTTDRERYGPEARVRVRALLRDARYRPIALETVRLALVDEAGSEQAAVEVTTDGEGRAEAELEGPARPGAYRAVALRAGERLAEEAFVVESGGDELADPRADPAYLEALAESAGGVAWGSPEAAPDLGAIDATRTEHLGSVELAPFASPWALLGALLLFAGEWWLRRRAGVR